MNVWTLLGVLALGFIVLGVIELVGLLVAFFFRIVWKLVKLALLLAFVYAVLFVPWVFP